MTVKDAGAQLGHPRSSFSAWFSSRHLDGVSDDLVIDLAVVDIESKWRRVLQNFSVDVVAPFVFSLSCILEDGILFVKVL